MNYINKGLAKHRNLDDFQISSLNAIHYALESMVEHHNQCHANLAYPPKHVKELRKKVRNLEYLMQELWGFGQNELNHKHWRRFNALNPPGEFLCTVTAENKHGSTTSNPIKWSIDGAH